MFNIPTFHALSKMTLKKIFVALLKFPIRGSGHQSEINSLIGLIDGTLSVMSFLLERGLNTWTGKGKSHEETTRGPLEKQEQILPIEQPQGSAKCPGSVGPVVLSVILYLKRSHYLWKAESINVSWITTILNSIAKGTVSTFQGNYIWRISEQQPTVG